MPVERQPVREGLAIGLIAFAAVAVFYALFDLLAARGGLYTVGLLGRAVVRGERDPSILLLPIPPDWTAILGYSAIHLVLSLAIGVVVAALIARAERNPTERRAILLVIVAGFVVTILAVGLLTTPMRAMLPWWSIVVANSLAVLLAASYLLRRHPGLGGLMLGLSEKGATASG